MKKNYVLLLLAALFCFTSCSVLRTGTVKEDGKIDIVLLQVNDVYEIAPLEGGRLGGMARVATLKKQYLAQNPNTLLVMAGDFVSPSVYNGLKYQGQPIRGRQMIEAMNAAGIDIAAFGNHEFDISEQELQQRINESAFRWVSSNSFHNLNDRVIPFTKTVSGITEPLPQYIIKTFTDNDGTTAKVGFIGINIPFNKARYVTYKDPFATALTVYNQIKDSCNAVVAITHQLIEDDMKLAAQVPGLAVILGGHEHDMRFEKQGNIYITKAHANAKSAFVVKLSIDTRTRAMQVVPVLKNLNDSVVLDSVTSGVVKKWGAIADSSFRESGFNAAKVVMPAGQALDARESVIRRQPTALTQLIVKAMAYACPDANLVIFNAGSLRLDDELHPPVTQYDILRTLPYGGAIREADMTGRLLIKTLDAGVKNKGLGGFLQYSSFVTRKDGDGKWYIHNQPVEPEKIYKVALTDFLVSGKEVNLDFLNEKNYDIHRLYNPQTSPENSKSDIRLALIRYLEKM
ncbi:bifunctional metallophosphatase/5'-nucleotidase [Foetidibacter luteolus]|uniref:bifunctional metallophosphatase/5'-nucleotidase n=1 Tax=Foetidibacter luteolus TaxID=2608880 RepID=UPI00129A69AE|nr:bifunctional metallophosphatase/5'-nucleotidase [Foetidibacter luteolus]